MKHNLLKSLIISVILLTGVSNAWAAGKVMSGPRVYFDNSAMEMTPARTYYIVNHENYGRYYGPMKEIENTKLLYFDVSTLQNFNTWPDAIYVSFLEKKENDSHQDGGWGPNERIRHANKYTATNSSWESINWQNTYYSKATTNGGALTFEYKELGYNGIPKYTATQAVKIREHKTDQYTELIGTWPAELTIQGTFLSTDGKSDRSTTTSTTSSGYNNYDAVVTGLITQTYSITNSDYVFDGWGTGDEPSENGDSYNYNITENTKVYAFFTKRTYTVKIGNSSYGTYEAIYNDNSYTRGESFEVTKGESISITNIKPNDGYDQTMVYKTGTEYTYFSDSTEIDGKRTYTYIVNSDVEITEDFRTKEEQTIYFKVPTKNGDADGTWKNLKIQYFHYLEYQNDKIKDVTKHDVTEVKSDANYIYYRFTVPKGKHSFQLLTKDGTESSVHWYELLPKQDVRGINENCWLIDKKANNNDASGEWVSAKVYLDPCAYCEYGITCDGKDTYLNHATEERMIELPYGSKLKIVDAHNISPYYMPNPRYSTSVVINRAFETSTNSSLTLYDEIRYSANVVTKETQRVYLHLPSNLKNAWINGKTGNDWFNCIYLRDYLSHGRTLDPEQNNGSNVEYGKVVKGFSHESFDANEDEYWYIDIPAGFNAFGFERKNSTGQGTGFANRTIEFEYEIPLDGVDNCFTINSTKVDGRYTGTWGPLPNCTVKLGYTDIGRFGVRYKGETFYEEKIKDDDGNRSSTYIYVPYGAEIEVLAGEPGNDAFANSMVYVDEAGQKTKLDFTEQTTSHTFQVTGDVTVDDLFGTKQDYYIYIGIPKNQDVFEDWDLACTDPNHNGDQMYIWCHWPHGGFGGYENYGGDELIKRNVIIDTEDMIYYQFELPQGVYKFAFQCKENKDQNNTSAPHAFSVDQYNPPLTTADCFVLDGGKSGDGGKNGYTGYWTSMPSDGDFRLLYVEQIVTKKEKVGDEWITEVKRTYQHPSDIVKPHELDGKGRIVSLHIYTRGQNPEVILQKYSDTQKKWIDIEAHMVNGPLETDDPGMGLLPGRKNASPGSEVDDFVYDDGIEKIKNDDEDDGCGVWDFTIKKVGDNAQLDLVNGLKRYEGKYYIRTTNAEGEWMNYTLPSNHMTFSPYAKQHHGEYFSHYFCKWVDINKHYRDVSFIIANDHAQNLTDPSSRFDDQYVTNQWLPGSTNIRWGWSIINNKVSRAYIAGSYNYDNEFLVVKGPDNDTKVRLQKNINGEDGYFNDNTNWLYYADLEAQPEAQVQVKAKYNDKYQYFMGTSDPDQYQKLIGGDYANDKRYYPIRILYDFKEHRFVVGYHPETEITDKVAIETPVMLIREHHNAPNQITFNNDNLTIEAPMPAYGVITFLEKELKSDKISKNAKMFYWVSFPFDVRISHAFGLGEYGSHWVMEEYDGKARAEEGWNIYNTFWKYITDTATTLYAGKGYVLCLNYNRVINEAFLSAEYDEKISLYFPSLKEINKSTIQSQGPKEITIPTWTGRAPTKDHNWNLIGAISYANTGETTQQSNSKFLYEYQPAKDTYSPKSSNGYTFNALHAYMVQYGGKITWNNFIAPQSIAAKRDTDSDNDIHALSLDLICNGTVQDQTFIQLEDGEATQMFDLNIDMTKIINSGSNIYSFSTDNNKLAGSVLPIEETIIPLGVVSATAGEYTFAMPDGTDGIVVELIDYETNTRTNMLLDEYTISLGKGTFDNRFALHVKPDKTTTSVDNIGNEATGDKVKKYLIDGVLYMQKDGVLYDAQGRCVQ